MRLVWATVVAADTPEGGLQRLRTLADGDAEDSSALSYTDLAGTCATGERVLLNTTAVDLVLGTGGSHFVVARIGDGAGESLRHSSGGHVMKLRYTPLQTDVLSVEEEASPHHAVMAEADSLGGMPVVCCSLHSQLPIVAAAVKGRRPGARVAYVATDEAALPLALSGLVRACREAGLVDETVTCGQAFGGGLEAVTLHSGLLAARHVASADVAIVAIGPGVVGTGTRWGHGGVAQGEAVNAVAVLGGRPVVALRLSFADARERHRGVSHHTLAALRVALAPALVAVPALPAEQALVVDRSLAGAGVWGRHEAAAAEGALPDLRGVRATTMGRGPQDDPAFFSAAAAAGEVAADLLSDG